MPTKQAILDIVPGDTITFKSMVRSGNIKAVRKVTGHYTLEGKNTGQVSVTKFHGWTDFIVRPHEILEIRKA